MKTHSLFTFERLWRASLILEFGRGVTNPVGTRWRASGPTGRSALPGAWGGWLALLLGALALTARPASAASTLIPAGAVWKYLDNGTDPGTAWQGVAFDDSAWNSGPAQLGYGDGDEATVLSSGPDQFSRYVTTYFRHRFELLPVIPTGNLAVWTGGNLTLRLLRDDGAVVYINGVEVFRSNMPVGPVTYQSLATAAVGGAEETTQFVSTSLHPSVLLPGTNVVAVEVHQVNVTSSDLSFDLELIQEDGGTDQLPVVNVIATSPNAAEGGLNSEGLSGAFTFQRLGGLISEPLTVRFELSGSASNGVDYARLSNAVTFAPGATEARLLVAPSFDNAVEGTETVVVTLEPPVCALVVPPPPGCYRVGPQNQAVVFIADFPPRTNQPPFLQLNWPQTGDVFVAPANIWLSAFADDPEESYDVKVEFFEGANRLGEGVFVPTLCPSPFCPFYALTWSNVPPGEYSLTAKATDSAGAMTISAPVNIRVTHAGVETNVTLVATGSVWKYLDLGIDAGTAWRQILYDDSAWAADPAELGYGDGDEATRVSFGPDPFNKYITTYFRKRFDVANAASIAKLKALLIQDDGSVVYLNGVEVFRYNLPAGPISFNTLAIASTEYPPVEFEFPPGLLLNGANLVAVEVHQSNPASSDLSFDFGLVAELGPVVSNRPPAVTITAPTNGAVFVAPAEIQIEAVTVDPDGYANKVEFFANNVKIGEAEILFIQPPPPGEPIHFEFHWQNPPVGPHRLTARTRDDRGAPGSSPPVDITVLGTPPGDSDGDGVPNDRDRCSGTAAGAVVNADGCSLAQLCPCAGPWRSHGAYVRCVVEHAWEFYRAGLITAAQRREAIAQAVASDCGRQPGEGDVLLLFPVPQTPVELRAQGNRYCVIAPAGRQCLIECSNDLQNWRPLETLTLTECETERLDSPGAEPARFYRARLEP